MSKTTIKVFQSQKNPTGTDWSLLVTKLAPTAVDDVEAVGYMIRKEFSVGWYDLTPQPSTDVTPATPSCQSNDNYDDEEEEEEEEEELNSWIWRSSRVQWPRSTTNTK